MAIDQHMRAAPDTRESSSSEDQIRATIVARIAALDDLLAERNRLEAALAALNGKPIKKAKPAAEAEAKTEPEPVKKKKRPPSIPIEERNRRRDAARASIMEYADLKGSEEWSAAEVAAHFDKLPTYFGRSLVTAANDGVIRMARTEDLPGGGVRRFYTKS
jgi:hypothetical protein